MAARAAYTAADLELLTGLEPVRRRPGMFTDTSCPNHLLNEVIDNSADEAAAGYASRIEVTLEADGVIVVEDDGRGIPVDVHPEYGVSGVELIMTKLHAGGKFSRANYAFSGGLHGVGVSVVNALSDFLEVTVRRGGKECRMSFTAGEPDGPLRVARKLKRGEASGTVIRFRPQASYFSSPALHLERLRHTLRAKAVLCPGLRMALRDQMRSSEEEWRFEDGLAGYLKEQQGEAAPLPPEPICLNHDQDNCKISLAMFWCDEAAAGAVSESYVNLIPTAQGGTHVNGLRQGAGDALRQFCEARKLLPRNVKLTAEDVCRHCSWVLSVWLPEPQFQGQTKERLSTPEVTSRVAAVVRDGLVHFLHQHAELGERIAAAAIRNAESRQRSEQARGRKRQRLALPTKLTDCLRSGPDGTELFLVEGDSAGGTARSARNKEFQALLPLRGKILNTWEVDSARVLESQEIHDIASAIGVSPGSKDVSGLRYGKICILADADSDGSHIATLLLALFMRHFRSLVSNGHVYVAQPPLYRVDHAKKTHYVLDDYELQKLLEGFSSGAGAAEIMRFKGLGEMNPSQLRETAMDPKRRRLLRLVADGNDTDSVEMLDMLLLRKNSEARRNWLESKGNLATV